MTKIQPWSTGYRGAQYAAAVRNERRVGMDEHQKDAFGKIFDAGESVSKVIVHAKASMQPLDLPEEIIAKLIEGQQALFAAQRLMMNLA